MIYLDNPATSWPKPPAVIRSVARAMKYLGANPGRGAHSMANRAGDIILECRLVVAQLLGASDLMRICFMKNITEAINTALWGVLEPGHHVICSSMEHNSILRPLREFEARGGELSLLPCDERGRIDPQKIPGLIKANTRMIALNHGSNVTGTLQPAAEVGRICRDHDLLFLLDTAQTAGHIPIHMEEMAVDLLAFTGHKGLRGPMGTGVLILGERVKELKPLIHGGTGSLSEAEVQPRFFPDSLESGTPNVPALAGLLESLRWVEKKGLSSIEKREKELLHLLRSRILQLPGVKIWAGYEEEQLPLLSFTMEGHSVSQVGEHLSRNGIACRVGLHCAPSAHRTLGSFPEGTVRLGVGYFNKSRDIEKTARVLSKIVIGGRE